MYRSFPRCLRVRKFEALFVFDVEVVMNMEKEARHLLLRFGSVQNARMHNS